MKPKERESMPQMPAALNQQPKSYHGQTTSENFDQS